MMTGSPSAAPVGNEPAAGGNRRPTILLSECSGFSRSVTERLHELGNLRLRDLQREDLLAEVADADVLWIRLRHRIDAEVLAAAPRLRAIVSPTTGLDHIDVEAAATRSVAVLTLREHTAALRDVRATAEHTIGLMLSLLRHLPAAFAHVGQGGWDRDLFWGGELYGKTIGIVGYGRLGRLVARYLNAFGATVLVADRPGGTPSELEEGIEACDLDELLGRSSIVSLHASLNETSREMIGEREIAVMQQDALLVNTARGALVREDALLAALCDGRLAGAALDVVADEHGEGSRELLDYARDHANLLVTPHIGGATLESREKTESLMADQLAAFLAAERS